MTIPQVIMLNHAAHVNSERMKAKIDSPKKHVAEAEDELFMGTPIEELDDEGLDRYFKTFPAAFR